MREIHKGKRSDTISNFEESNLSLTCIIIRNDNGSSRVKHGYCLPQPDPQKQIHPLPARLHVGYPLKKSP